MKYFLIIPALFSAIMLRAQDYPLSNAANIILQTRGTETTGRVSQQEKDRNDSTVILRITTFRLPAKRAAVFDKVLDEFNREAEEADGSHSWVSGSGTEQMDDVEGVRKVGLYYAEGKPSVTTGDGHSYVSVRRNLANPIYRRTTCIEWWPEDGSVCGRIINVQGPVGKQAYKKTTSSAPAPRVYSYKDPTVYSEFYSDSTKQVLREIRNLVRIYKAQSEESPKRAIAATLDRRILRLVTLPHPIEVTPASMNALKDMVLKPLFRSLSEIPGYTVMVTSDPASAARTGIHELKLEPGLRRLADDMLQSLDIYGVSYEILPGDAKEAGGHFTVYVNLIERDAAAPDILVPEVESPSSGYRDDNYRTFAVYRHFQTTPAPPDFNPYDKYALWCLEDRTLLVKITYMFADKQYMRMNSRSCIVNSMTGECFYPTKAQGLPTDETFWIKGYKGNYICTVTEYPALPLNCTRINLVSGPVLDKIPGTTGWAAPESIVDVPVSVLQSNQRFISLR